LEGRCSEDVSACVNESLDVLVVGGGPCGSFSALAAAKSGAKVSVVEEHSEIGRPSHCAGHVSIHGLKTLGLEIPSDIIENRISVASFHSPSGKTLRIECEKTVTYVIDRLLFDQYLAELAHDAGVSYLKGTGADSFWIEANRVRGIFTRGEKRLRMECKVVIDAEGVGASLLRKARLSLPHRDMMVIGAQGDCSRVSNVESNSVEIYLGSNYAPGFFAWIVPRQDGSAKVGLAANRGNPKLLLERFATRHPTASKKISEPLSDVTFHPIPLGGPRSRTHSDGLIIVGDAASQVKPTTGGGIVFGLTCSRIAGTTAAEGVYRGDCSSRFLSRYEASWGEVLGREFSIGRFTRKILSGLSDRAVDRIFSIAKELQVEGSIDYLSEIDFEEMILQHCLRKPNVALAFVCSLFSCMLS